MVSNQRNQGLAAALCRKLAAGCLTGLGKIHGHKLSIRSWRISVKLGSAQSLDTGLGMPR